VNKINVIVRWKTYVISFAKLFQAVTEYVGMLSIFFNYQNLFGPTVVSAYDIYNNPVKLHRLRFSF